MQTTSPEPGFAPWSLMVPAPPKADAVAAKNSETATKPANDDGVKSRENPEFFGEDGLSFGDFLDIVNPLQHLPVIGTIYREITGDEISQGARLAGDTLYGGPLGLAGAIVNNAVEEHSGKDIGENLIAMVTGDDADEIPPETQIANAAGTPSETATAQQPSVRSDQSPDLSPDSTRNNAAVVGNPVAEASGSQTAVHPFAVSTPQTGSPLFGARNQSAQATVANPQPTAPDKAATPQPVSYGKPQRLSEDVARQLKHIAALSQERQAVQARANQEILKKAGRTNTVDDPELPMPTAPTPPAKEPEQPIPAPVTASKAEVNSATKAYQATAAPSPTEMENIPEAMLSALKKYENMLKKGS